MEIEKIRVDDLSSRWLCLTFLCASSARDGWISRAVMCKKGLMLNSREMIPEPVPSSTHLSVFFVWIKSASRGASTENLYPPFF